MTRALCSLIPASQPNSQPGSQPGFMDIARLDGEDGLVTVISQRSKDGALTFAMFREFDRHGERERTSFVNSAMVQKYIDHACKTKQALADIEGTWAVDGVKLPFPPGGRRSSSRFRVADAVSRGKSERGQSESDRQRERQRGRR